MSGDNRLGNKKGKSMICSYDESQTLKCDILYRGRELYRQMTVRSIADKPSCFYLSEECNCVPNHCPRFKEFQAKIATEQQQKQK